MIHCKFSMPTTLMTQLTVVNLAEPGMLDILSVVFQRIRVLLHMCLRALDFGTETDLVEYGTHTSDSCSSR